MKTKTLITTVLFMMGTMAFAVANDAPGMAVVAIKGSEVFKVIYKSATAGKVKLNIFDFDNKLILSETIYGLDGFIFPVNFKGLSKGNYTIELTDATGKQSAKVFYQPPYDVKSIHVSKLQDSEGRFLLSVATTQKEDIFIKIYNASNKLVYSGSKLITEDFAQVYKIEHPSGSYTFEVSDLSGHRKYFNF